MRKSIRILRLVLLAPLALTAAAGAVGVAEIRSPRPAGWTVDLTGTLPADTRSALDRLGDEVKAQTGAEMAVVVVGTTGGVEPRAFATQLFNRWGIGERGRSNGLLVFAALDDRAAEIILGDGVDDPERQAASSEVMQGEMVPRFRAGDPAGAVFHGAVACARRILGAAPTAVGDEGTLRAETPVAAPGEALPLAEPSPAEPLAPFPLVEEPPTQARGGLTSGMFAIGAGLTGLLVVAGLVVRRRRPRRCPKCGLEMARLEEEADDDRLKPAERVEERVGSVDYDVWVCPGCGETLKQRYNALFTRYARCPGCGALTKSTSRQTLESATERSEGLVEVDESCAHCTYRRATTHRTPRLQRVDPSSSSGSSRLRGGSSSSSSSGFGGGRSSGGGASGRW